MSVTIVLSLVQDFAIAAPIVRTAGERDVLLLVAERLANTPGAMATVARLAQGREHTVFANTAEAIVALNHRAGLVLFASESRSVHHRPSHALAAALPGRFVSATLQHGYECLGFLHNAAHEASRQDAGFATDIVASWFDRARMPAIPPVDQAKHFQSGSTLFLDDAPHNWLASLIANAPAPPPHPGPILVCENLQSVRLRGAPAAAFLDELATFAKRRPVTLRPHPAGAFAKGEAEPPAGVSLDPRPIEDADLEQYAAALSPPSTVLFDLIRRDVPVAIWEDPYGLVDSRHYRGLPHVSGVDDWHAFFDQPPSTDGQRAFIRALGFPADTPARFETLLALGDDVAASGNLAQNLL